MTEQTTTDLTQLAAELKVKAHGLEAAAEEAAARSEVARPGPELKAEQDEAFNEALDEALAVPQNELLNLSEPERQGRRRRR